MTDKKISQLANISGADLADSDEFVIARASTSENFAVTKAELFKIGDRSFSTRAAMVAAWSDLSVEEKSAVRDGTVWTDGTVSYVASTGATAIGDMPGWLPVEPVNVRHFGAVCDGATDDLAAFNAADNYGKSPVIIDADCVISTGLTGPSVVFETRNRATVTQAGGNFFPVEERRAGRGGEYRQRVNFTAADPSSAYDGSQGVYPILYDGVGFLTQTTNYWGNGDLVANTWRTGVDTFFAGAAHYGKGDYYLYRANGTVYRHADHASVSSIHGHNNIGMFNGQVNAGGDQVTLYGLGDQVLNDAGYDNVAQRGMVLIHIVEGDDTGHGYGCDRFSYMSWSRGTNDIDGGFVARGNMRCGFYTGGATLSDNAAYAMAEGQRVYFDASGDLTSEGYFPASGSFGDYWAVKSSSGNYLEIGANGSATHFSASVLEYTPASEAVGVFRVNATSVAGSYLGSGMIGNVGYIGAYSTSANTTFSIRTAASGVEADSLIVNANGSVNIARSGARLQMNGTNVLSARQTGWGAPTGTATRTSFDTTTVTTEQLAERVHALIDDLTTHGMIGA